MYVDYSGWHSDISLEGQCAVHNVFCITSTNQVSILLFDRVFNEAAHWAAFPLPGF